MVVLSVSVVLSRETETVVVNSSVRVMFITGVVARITVTVLEAVAFIGTIAVVVIPGTVTFVTVVTVLMVMVVVT
jgi:hypothetical protein